MSEVIAIHIGKESGGRLEAVPEVTAVPGKGLEGDRKFKKAGVYTDKLGLGKQVTLIEVENLEWLAREHGIDLEARESRRNILTRGVRLNDLVGKTFRVGAVTMRGVQLCEPCRHLSALTGKPLVKTLLHRAGLNAEILVGGKIRVGDPVVREEPR